jgi:hypothetical protein
MRPRIFIHTNDKQLVGALVSKYSLYRNTRHRNSFTVDIINLRDFPALTCRQGHAYLREGNRAIWDNADLQSFTPLRFLPPQLCEYSGRALVIDPDVFAVSDIWDLLQKPMNGHAILARRIRPNDGRAAYWASSVMLLDCSRLRHWKWDLQLQEMFSFKRDYREWISLNLEPDGSIGELEDVWNHYDRLDESTRLLHNTGRATQPWKTGLPIDFMPKKATRTGLLARLRACVGTLLKPEQHVDAGHYRRHPDPRQEALFFSLLRECVNAGEITRSLLREEITKRHIRKDALEMIDHR